MFEVNSSLLPITGIFLGCHQLGAVVCGSYVLYECRTIENMKIPEGYDWANELKTQYCIGAKMFTATYATL